MLRVVAVSPAADPDLAWQLFVEPGRWHEWAPHLRGAWGLGDPEVEPGRRGAVRLLGALPVPVAITAKDTNNRTWSWRVAGTVEMTHAIEAGAGAGAPGGATATLTIRAPAPLEAALRATYGPLTAMLLRRLLSRSATARPRPTGTGSPAG